MSPKQNKKSMFTVENEYSEKQIQPIQNSQFCIKTYIPVTINTKYSRPPRKVVFKAKTQFMK